MMINPFYVSFIYARTLNELQTPEVYRSFSALSLFVERQQLHPAVKKKFRSNNRRIFSG